MGNQLPPMSGPGKLNQYNKNSFIKRLKKLITTWSRTESPPPPKKKAFETSWQGKERFRWVDWAKVGTEINKYVKRKHNMVYLVFA